MLLHYHSNKRCFIVHHAKKMKLSLHLLSLTCVLGYVSCGLYMLAGLYFCTHPSYGSMKRYNIPFFKKKF